jgi:hypothetical protein
MAPAWRGAKMDKLDLALAAAGLFLIAQGVLSWEWFWDLRNIGPGGVRTVIRFAFVAIGAALIFFAVFA